jgi:anion-transporting  ArsA/GET3 family ATPase
LPLPALEDKRLVVVLGKGGVGRTTIACALAAHLAARGKKTLLFQANAKERAGTLLGGATAGEDIRQARENLWTVNTNPTAALHEYGLMVLRLEAVYKMVFENRISRALVRAIPGLDDYAILGKLWYHTTETERGQPRFDCIVFDAPATGHAVTLLGIPKAILAAVPEGPLTRDALKVRALVEDPVRTAALIVTLPEEMPVNESVELRDRLEKEVLLKPSGVIVNQLYPDHFPAGSPGARILERVRAEGDPVLEPVVIRARASRARRALNDRNLERLRAELPFPTVIIPKIFVPQLGPRELGDITRLVGAAIGRSS